MLKENFFFFLSQKKNYFLKGFLQFESNLILRPTRLIKYLTRLIYIVTQALNLILIALLEYLHKKNEGRGPTI